MDKDFYIQLIHKQLTGEISPKENRLLENHLQDNPAAVALLEEIELTWQLSQPAIDIPEVDSAAELKAVRDQLGLNKPKVVPLWPKFMKIAAVALVLITASIFLFNSDDLFSPNTIEVLAVDATKEITLPDKTTIWLQEGSKLAYTSAYDKDNRYVELTGTAYFDVERNETLPFQITTGDAAVTVLGTSFQVIQEETTTAVHVYSGRVSLAGDDKESILVKNQSAIHNSGSKTISPLAHQNEDALIWKNKRFVFRDITLTAALRQLERYNEDVITVENEQLLQCTINAVIQSTSSESVLKRLSESLETNVVKIDDHTYVLKGGKCP